MENTITSGQIETLLQGLFLRPILDDSTNIISLTGNELADISLKVSKYIRDELPIDQLLENTISMLGEAGIAERVLLFQLNNDNSKALLTHYWGSPYIPKFNSVDFELDLENIPLLRLFHLNESHSLQIEEIAKYLTLPNYLLKNKLKATLLKLKTKSLMLTIGSAQKLRIVLNLQFSTRNVVWGNEIEKVLQSVIDQLAVAIQRFSDEKKKEALKKDLIRLQENAIIEQEKLLRKFTSDLHDLPCSIIPSLKKAIGEKDFNTCTKLVDELHNNLRQLINEYILPDLNILGFVNNIYQFINGFRKTFKGNIVTELPEEEINIPHKKANELFKVIKEWFCNIEKHSEASEIQFTLKKLNDYYFLINISDNGKGFDTNDTKTLGYGITNIKRRLLENNSKFEIKSGLNKGTSLKIQFSL